MDETQIITLRCIDCDNPECPYARNYIPYDSLEGCTREVLEDDAARYYFYMNEALPFRGKNAASLYEEIMAFLTKIYKIPVKAKLNAKGKTVKHKLLKK